MSRACLFVVVGLASAGNPVVPNVGMADPHVHVFDGKFYMYSTHDYSPSNNGFRMDDWRVWESSDLVSWTLASTLYPNQTAASPGEYSECWATDAATSNGKYYFYFSMGGSEIGVVSSSVSPSGPWDNPLGSQALINASLGPSLSPPTTSRDPGVFADDATGDFYIVFGVFEFYVAKLGADLMSLAEEPRHVTIINALGPFGYNKTDDKPFLHAANGLYYLSWGCFYGVSTTGPYGPFTYTGSVVDTAFIAPDFRMNVTGGPFYEWEDYTDRHGSFWTSGGQWFYAANDRSHSADTKGPGYYRDTVIGYVDFYANGTIKPVIIDSTGVGEYRGLAMGLEGVGYLLDSAAGVQPLLAWQAEHFFSLSGGGRARKGHDTAGVFGVHGVDAATTLSYPNVRSVPSGPLRYWVRYAGAACPLTAVVSASPSRTATSRGEVAVPPTVLCRAALLPGGGVEVYRTATCVIDGGLGASPVDLDVVLTFEGEDGCVANVDSMGFSA